MGSSSFWEEAVMGLTPTGIRDGLSFFLLNVLEEITSSFLEGSVVVSHGLCREGSVDKLAITPMDYDSRRWVGVTQS